MELPIIDGLRTSHLKKAHQVGLLEGDFLLMVVLMMRMVLMVVVMMMKHDGDTSQEEV